jgi:NAD-dependent DNA ligase
MGETQLRNLYNRAQIDDRQVNELIGLARGIIADGAANQAEAEYLYKWLAQNKDATGNPIIATLFDRVRHYFGDGKLDVDEAAELFETLQSFSGGPFELGEATKSTSLPLCSPPPAINYVGQNFCLTGTFAYGSRKDCEATIADRGGSLGGVSKKTNYLIIGIYATDSWAHSSYGRKIERAAELRSEGAPISIVGEEHWVASLSR